MTFPSIDACRRSLCLAALVLGGLHAGAANSQTVTIRNAQLRVMKELRTRAELVEFHRYWGSKQPTGQTSAEVQDWSYTMDIVSGASVDRWLYQSNGMATKVDAGVQRVFQIRSPQAFNSLIGAPRY